MVDLLYVGRGERTFGPFSTVQLQGLAAAGKLRSTDTVRREGMEKGVLVSKVKNLFPAQPTPAPTSTALAESEFPPTESVAPVPSPAEDTPDPSDAPVVSDTLADPGSAPLIPLAPLPAPDEAPPKQLSEPKPARPPEKPHKRRAVALKGAILLSQDGEYVSYRKKCVVCNFEDTSRSTMRIGNGVTRVNFYCRKCRKSRDIQIHGSMQ